MLHQTERPANQPWNFQHARSGCEMFFARNGSETLTQPRSLITIGEQTYAELETRLTEPSGISVLDQYRMLVTHMQLNGFPVIIGMVDAMDEASVYPGHEYQTSNKMFIIRIGIGESSYLSFSIPDVLRAPNASRADLELTSVSPHKVSALDGLDWPYYDAIFNRGHNRVGVQLGRMFIPFIAKAGETVTHPRTNKSHLMLGDSRGIHFNTELLVLNYQKPENRIPNRSFPTVIKWRTGGKVVNVTDRHTTNLGYQQLGPKKSSFVWTNEGYQSALNQNEADLSIALDQSALMLERTQGVSVYMPRTTHAVPLPLSASDTPEILFMNLTQYVADQVLPRILVNGNLVDLRGFSPTTS